MANAYAHGKIAKTYPAFLAALESWMKGQRPGYRDFHRYTGRMFRRGKLVCSQHIVRCAPPSKRVPFLLPSDFLFGRPGTIPAYLLLELGVPLDVLRPFPKHKGIRVKAPTRDHPPPHIHVEMPIGDRVKRRCLWPSLDSYGGDPPLSRPERTKLDDYLRKFGSDICKKLRLVYNNPHLRMPAL
jgi:hypothetical protein